MHMKKSVTELPGVTVAVVEGVAADGRPLLRSTEGEQEARPASPVWMERQPDWSSCKGLRAIVGFEGGDESKPVLLGLLDAPPGEGSTQPAGGKLEVLRLESERELILECGKAKISLRADGRIVILGGYVLSRSKGVNKIKGGSVQIN